MNLGSIAARNAWRNKYRMILTVLGATVAVLAFVTLRTVYTAWTAGVEHAAKDRLATRHKVSFLLPMPKRYIETIRGVPGVTQTCFISYFGGKDPKDPSNRFPTIAVGAECLDVLDELVIEPDQKRAWLSDRRGAILGDVLAKRLGVGVGDRITLEGTLYPGAWQFDVRAIYRTSRRSLDRSQFLFHWDYLNESLPPEQRDQIGWISTRVDDPARSAAVSAEIDRIFEDRDVQTLTMSERAMNLSSMAMLSAILSALNVISIIILAIMMMILGNTIAMGVRERTREYGVLRALGFSSRHVAMFIVGEAATLGLFAGVLGVLVAYPLVELGLGRFLEENMGSFFPYFRISGPTMVAALILAVALSVIASILPAYRASRLPVAVALRRVA